MNKVTFYCKDTPRQTPDGITYYPAYPRPEGGKADSAIDWASSGKQPPKVYTTENKFTGVVLLEDISLRGMGAKIPTALLPLPEHGVYVKIDFRIEGLIETILYGTVDSGNISCEMGLTFASGNYRLMPTSGPSFKVYEESLEKKAKPTKPSSEGYTTKAVVGHVYKGSWDSTVMYLGKFDCTMDPDASSLCQEGKKVHVYIDVTVHSNGGISLGKTSYGRTTDHYLTVQKSPMKVRPLNDGEEARKVFERLPDIIETRYGCKASYGFNGYTVVVDRENNTVKYENRITNNE